MKNHESQSQRIADRIHVHSDQHMDGTRRKESKRVGNKDTKNRQPDIEPVTSDNIPSAYTGDGQAPG